MSQNFSHQQTNTTMPMIRKYIIAFQYFPSAKSKKSATAKSENTNLLVYRLLQTLCLLMSTNVYNRPHEMSYLCRVFRKGASAYTSLCLRSTFVHSSFDLRSSFVRPSFDLRSGFVREAKTNEDKTKRSDKTTKNQKTLNLKS